ncbi:hypothetical protein MUG78_15980 [Gordonia alkaliphila]|uniref:hypothetical protein n=1 Tax=Gordonia alkaliphila TaxID=1053547 RepID=UPI001FF2C839|nr:hypothetical protein [Gordonia alkaliphila]MCK0440909.1 hypothetical protein [Gordonia alkaliphila]
MGDIGAVAAELASHDGVITAQRWSGLRPPRTAVSPTARRRRGGTVWSMSWPLR